MGGARARSVGGREGEIGRNPGLSGSARRMNCKGVSGELAVGVDRMDRGL